MKNIKCLLGHNLHIIKLNDVTKHQYDNDEENVTVYKCKYCGKIIAGKTDSIKASFKKPEEKEKSERRVDIKEYQGWSVINTEHVINVLGDENIGYIHLVLKDKSESEVEMFGLMQIIEKVFKRYEGLDTVVEVFKSKYNKDEDSISGKYYNYYSSVYEASQKLKYCDFKLEEAEEIITIKYIILNRRYEKSRWWKFWNKRKCIIENNLY